jgi:hypothetical protein
MRHRLRVILPLVAFLISFFVPLWHVARALSCNDAAVPCGKLPFLALAAKVFVAPLWLLPSAARREIFFGPWYLLLFALALNSALWAACMVALRMALTNHSSGRA